MWNPKNFKGHVNPHEVMQAISTASYKMFKIGEQKDPALFLSWLLNSLHSYISTKKKDNIISDLFRGSLLTRTENLMSKEAAMKKELSISDGKDTPKPFWMLSLDLPNVPLYKEGSGELITIPQTSLETLFNKFDGKTPTDDTRAGTRTTYKIVKLPKYLILAIKRFVKNDFFVEKNNTLVSFTLKDIDLSHCKTELKIIYVVDVDHKEKGKSYKYSLIAQIVHDGKPVSGTYKTHVLQKVTGQWIEIQDLNVLPIMQQMVSLSEAYMLVLEMQ